MDSHHPFIKTGNNAQRPQSLLNDLFLFVFSHYSAQVFGLLGGSHYFCVNLKCNKTFPPTCAK